MDQMNDNCIETYLGNELIHEECVEVDKVKNEVLLEKENHETKDEDKISSESEKEEKTADWNKHPDSSDKSYMSESKLLSFDVNSNNQPNILDKNIFHDEIKYDNDNDNFGVFDVNRNYQFVKEFEEITIKEGNDKRLSKKEGLKQLEGNYENNLIVPSDQIQFPTPESITDDECDLVNTNESKDNKSSVVTVKFRIDSNETMTSAFKIQSKVYQVKERLASIFNVNADEIKLKHEGNECDDLLPLSGLGVEPLQTIELSIQSINPKTSLAPGQFRHYIPVVDVITVRVQLDEGGFKDIVVEIENLNSSKEWLGGYRHRLTRVEYHHASVQTLPRRRSPDLPKLFSRDSQTPGFPFKERGIQTKPSKMTQISQTDLYIPQENDRIIDGKSDRFENKVSMNLNFFKLVRSVIRIKRVFKEFSQRLRNKEIEKFSSKLFFKIQEENENKLMKVNERQIKNPTFPIKRGDFYMLYLMIGKWWKKEIEIIKKTKHEEAKKAAFIKLLEKEIELLSVIDKQRIQAKKEAMKRQELQFLDRTARPIIFCNKKGYLSSIDTVETQLAREYQKILSSFMRIDVTKEERIEILNGLKKLIQDYGFCEFTNEIITLIERECNLLMLGMKNKQLKPLRERIEQLIIHYLHDYIVNPASKRYKKTNFLKTSPIYYQCTYCKILKPVSDYNVHVKMTSFSICRSCEWIKNIGHQRIDLSPYSRMLEQVRQSEMENRSHSSICFILQVLGMYYLTRYIWNDHSVISENENLDELRMVRFRKNEDWSPWNCILLTQEESIVHLNLSDVASVYEQSFLKKIEIKHLRAKNHFLPLLLDDKKKRETENHWLDNNDSSKYLNSNDTQKVTQSSDFEFSIK